MPSVIVNYCACGCRESIPNTATWFPGHAVRHATRLRREALAGSMDARTELYRRGWNISTAGDKSRSPYAFGFEAEFFGMDQSDAVQVLQNAGLTAQDDGYHHNTVPYWRITEDGSVSNEGCELVSPILGLRNKPDLQNARLSVDVLRNAGGVVNASCGLHVHHNLVGKKVVDVAETVGHWALFQPIIETMLPTSRWSGSYSNSMHNGPNWYRSVSGSDRGYDPGAEARTLANGAWGRYHAVNLQAISDHNTLEYRQHSGTLNPTKVEMWVRFTRAMHDVARVGSLATLLEVYGSEAAVQQEFGIKGMMSYLGLPAKVAKFYEERKLKLHGDSGRLHNDDDEDVGDYGDGNDYDYEDGDTDDDGHIWCMSCGTWHEDEG